MSARIYDRADWHAARRRRAQSGKAPRLSVERGILLRQRASGDWIAAIHEKRFGVWRKPESLCSATSFARAQAAALAAWKRFKLPLYWSLSGGRPQAYHVEAYAPRLVFA